MLHLSTARAVRFATETLLGAIALVAVVAPSARAQSLTTAAGAVTGCTSLSGQVSVSSPAPAGGTTFFLSTSSPAATTPSSVTISEGAKSASFFIGTNTVPALAPVTITATSGATVLTRVIYLMMPSPSQITVSPDRLGPDEEALGTVSLACPAGPGGVVVALTSNIPSALTVPATVVIPEGETSATFAGRAAASVTVPRTVSVSAAAGGASRSKSVTVSPPSIRAVTFDNSGPIGGATTQAIAALQFPAGSAGVTVTLTSARPTVAVPTVSSVFVPAGATTATFPVRTFAVAGDQNVVFTATMNGIATTGTLSVRKNRIDGVIAHATTLTPCRDASMTVHLVGPAGPEPVIVDLEISDPEHVGLSTEQLVFTEGVRALTFDVSAFRRATENGSVSVTMTFGAGTASPQVHTRSLITPRVSTRACASS